MANNLCEIAHCDGECIGGEGSAHVKDVALEFFALSLNLLCLSCHPR